MRQKRDSINLVRSQGTLYVRCKRTNGDGGHAGVAANVQHVLPAKPGRVEQPQPRVVLRAEGAVAVVAVVVAVNEPAGPVIRLRPVMALRDDEGTATSSATAAAPIASRGRATPPWPFVMALCPVLGPSRAVTEGDRSLFGWRVDVEAGATLWCVEVDAWPFLQVQIGPLLQVGVGPFLGLLLLLLWLMLVWRRRLWYRRRATAGAAAVFGQRHHARFRRVNSNFGGSIFGAKTLKRAEERERRRRTERTRKHKNQGGHKS